MTTEPFLMWLGLKDYRPRVVRVLHILVSLLGNTCFEVYNAFRSPGNQLYVPTIMLQGVQDIIQHVCAILQIGITREFDKETLPFLKSSQILDFPKNIFSAISPDRSSKF